MKKLIIKLMLSTTLSIQYAHSMCILEPEQNSEASIQNALEQFPKKAKEFIQTLDQNEKEVFLNMPESIRNELFQKKSYFLEKELKTDCVGKAMFYEKINEYPIQRNLLMKLLEFYQDNPNSQKLRYQFLSKEFGSINLVSIPEAHEILKVSLINQQSWAKEEYKNKAKKGTEWPSDINELFLTLDIHAEAAKRFYEKGIEFDQQGMTDKSILYFGKAAKSNNPAALGSVAFFYECQKDFNKAKELYQKAIKLGDKNSMNNLAFFYLEEGSLNPENNYIAFELFKQSAELGNPKAMINLSDMYQSGLGCPLDMNEATKWYQKAMDLGESKHTSLIEQIHFEESDKISENKQNYILFSAKDLLNWGVTRNDPHKIKQGIELLEKLIPLENTDAMMILGNIYEKEERIKNINKAIELYRMAEKKGNRDAIKKLANIYETQENLQEAKKWYKKYIHLTNDMYSILSFATLLEKSEEITDAIEYYKKAVKLGHDPAIKNLIRIVQNHNLKGSESIKLLEELIELGSVDAMLVLADIYKNGSKDGTIPQDSNKALDAYNLIIERKNLFLHPIALTSKGYILQKQNKIDEAKECYQIAASLGNIRSMNNLGTILQHEGKVDEAIEYYKAAMDLGNAEAMYNLGLIYLKNEDKISDAIEVFKKGSELDHINCVYKLALIFENKNDIKESLKWYLKAVKLDCVDAMIYLGGLYTAGTKDGTIIKDEKKAKEYYELAISTAKSKKDLEAINYIGNIYRHGVNTKKDLPKAFHLYQLAAELNDNNAMNNLGEMYQQGLGCKKNIETAIKYYKDAADLGNSAAMNNLGILHNHGLGVERNNKKAKEFFQKAANLNNKDALNNLGEMYRLGLGMNKDLQKAKEYYQKAVALNDPNAMNNLGIILHKEHNVTEALYLLEKAAGLNHLDAMVNLGNLCRTGGVFGFFDYNQAIKWYEKAAKQYHSSAMFNLGLMYFEGLWVNKNMNTAIKWFEKAGKLNHKGALNNLGFMHINGIGIAKNVEKGLSYFKKAIALCSTDAVDNVAGIYFAGKDIIQDINKAFELYEFSYQLKEAGNKE